MKDLKEIIKEAGENKITIGHFNISDIAGLKAIFEATRNLNLPVIIGVSEGERDFIGVRQVAALIKSLREEYDYPIFLNADHTHSLEKIKEAVEAGFDAVLFDPFDATQGRGSKLPLEENMRQTKEVVEYVKSVNPNILVEGELGYIGAGSVILKEIPKDAAIKPEDLTKPEEAARFVKETGVDLLAPAVGNLHGMLLASARTQINADTKQINADNISDNQRNYQRESASMMYMNPSLDIQRIRDIKKAVKIPLVLHGGSGIKNEDFKAAIEAGISIIHINTELRLAWRQGLEKSLRDNPEEITPYKLLPTAVEEIKKVVDKRLRLFNKLV